jgi:dUTP pyrophosphatase
MFVSFVCERSREVYKNGEMLKYETPGSSGMDLRAISVTEFSTSKKIDIGIGEETSEVGSTADAGYVLLPNSRALVHCGICVAVDRGLEVQIRSRSGLSWKHGVIVLNAPGTIDSDYRGEIGAILINTSDKPYCISLGERIAQMVVVPVHIASVFVAQELPQTKRGEAGFGSTGTK